MLAYESERRASELERLVGEWRMLALRYGLKQQVDDDYWNDLEKRTSNLVCGEKVAKVGVRG